MDILYFIACMLGGLFIVAIPFAGVVVLLLRNDRPAPPRTAAPAVSATIREREMAAAR
jgi:hypothetical protein